MKKQGRIKMPETPLDMIEGIEEQLDQAKLSTLFVFVREYWTLPIEIKHKSQEVYAYVRKITELTHQLEMTERRLHDCRDTGNAEAGDEG
jgi:hypothetical protein